MISMKILAIQENIGCGRPQSEYSVQWVIEVWEYFSEDNINQKDTHNVSEDRDLDTVEMIYLETRP